MSWDAIRCAEDFVVTFQRTLRVPADGKSYPLPPGLGTFPIYRAADYAARTPASWRAAPTLFIPLYQREALWIGFRSQARAPYAVKVAIGGFNVLTGAAHTPALTSDPQDYLVCPPQHWLDGVRTEPGVVRQFVAVALGQNQTLEAVLGGAEVRGGLQLSIHAAHAERLPAADADAGALRPTRSLGGAMGFAAGGQIVQKIYPDPYGLSVWDQTTARSFEVQVLNSRDFAAVTKQQPPPTPVDAQSYSARGLPWFALYDDELADIGGSSALTRAAETLDASSQVEPDAALGELRIEHV